MRIEDPEIRCCITARSGCPLPSAVVGGQVEVQQFSGEVRSPQRQSISRSLHQKTGSDHSGAVVHVTSGIQFTHACIDDGKACLSCTPGFIPLLIILPLHSIIRRFETAGHHVRKVPEYHLVELPPNEFIDILLLQFLLFRNNSRMLMVPKRRCTLMCDTHSLPDNHGSHDSA